MAFNKFEKFTMFPKSKPWGYHPEAVEKKINEYEVALGMVNNKLAEQVQVNTSLLAKIEKLENELREMHFQMSSLELPEVEEAVGHMVLDEFRHFNHDDPDEPTPKPSHAGIFKKKQNVQQNNDQSDGLNIVGNESESASDHSYEDDDNKFTILF